MNKTKKQKKPFFYGGVTTRRLRNSSPKPVKKTEQTLALDRLSQIVKEKVIKRSKLAEIIFQNREKIHRLVDLKRKALESIQLIEEFFEANHIGLEYYNRDGYIYIYLFLKYHIPTPKSSRKSRKKTPRRITRKPVPLSEPVPGHEHNYKQEKLYFYQTKFKLIPIYEKDDIAFFMDSLDFLPEYKRKELRLSNCTLYFFTTICLLNGFYFAYFVQGYVMLKSYLQGVFHAEKEDMTNMSSKMKNFNLMLCFYPKYPTSLLFHEYPEEHIIQEVFIDNEVIKEIENISLKEIEAREIKYDDNEDEDSDSDYDDSESIVDGDDNDSSYDSDDASEISQHDPGKMAILSETVEYMVINILGMIERVNGRLEMVPLAKKIERIEKQKKEYNDGDGWNMPEPEDLKDASKVDYHYTTCESFDVNSQPRMLPQVGDMSLTLESI